MHNALTGMKEGEVCSVDQGSEGNFIGMCMIQVNKNEHLIPCDTVSSVNVF